MAPVIQTVDVKNAILARIPPSTTVIVGLVAVVIIGAENATTKMQAIKMELRSRTKWAAVQKIVSHKTDGEGQWI